MLTNDYIADWFKSLQDKICLSLEAADGQAKFREDLWQRDGGGGGRTRVIQNGAVFEKGGVNFSAVYGKLPDKIKEALNVKESNFFATGVSIVIHPKSPMVPIIHMNVRYFNLNDQTKWFGGGIDLTPIYVREEDAKFFHQALKKVCDQFHSEYYSEFKKWADEYFYISHRNETRGVGGIFFDRLSETEEISLAQRFDFVKAVGEIFAPTYCTLVEKNKNLDFSDQQKEWQLIRRGRYVEFNLVYDKGTKFGLDTDGRVESILMSLPELASWKYDYQPQTGSEEEKTLSFLKKEVDWIALS